MRRHKYFARSTECIQEHKHPSAKESRRCNDLHILQATGQITNLQYEPKFRFEINGKPVMMRNGQCASYRPDFSYVENGKTVCEDVKSKATMTEAFALRAALFRHLYPDIELRMV